MGGGVHSELSTLNQSLRRRTSFQTSASDGIIAGQVLRATGDPVGKGYRVAAQADDYTFSDYAFIANREDTASLLPNVVAVNDLGSKLGFLAGFADADALFRLGISVGYGTPQARVLSPLLEDAASRVAKIFAMKVLGLLQTHSASIPSSALALRDAKRTKALVAQAEYLKALEANWDSYGAKAIKPEVVDEMVELLEEALVGVNVPAPDIIPGGGGSLQAEWRRKGYEVFFYRSRDGEYELDVEGIKTGQRFNFEGPEAHQMLRYWAQQIVD